MKLHIKPDGHCNACQKVIDWAKENNKELEILQEPQIFSKTYPTLVTEWGFVTTSENIISYLTTLK